jgi:dienelactone hydrolase
MKLKDRFFVFLVLLFLASLYLFLSRTTYDQVDISNALNKAKANLKVNQEIIVFDSKNPFNFRDVLSDLDKVSDQEVYAILTYPATEKETYPVVVGVAGSLGWGEHHRGYMNRYLDMGIATIALHSFKSRGIQSTVGEQISVTIAMMVHDAYMLLNEINKKPTLDIDNVAITGWSLGGGVSLFSAWKAVQQQLTPDLTFAAHFPIYPPCIANVDNLEFTDSPMHILIGELDTWVPAEPCVELIENLKNKGKTNAEITVFPDSHHSFDRDSELLVVDHAYSLADCRLVLDEDGTVRTKDYHFPLSNSLLQKVGLYFCASRGPTMGGNPEAAIQAKEISMDFMKRNLLGKGK